MPSRRVSGWPIFEPCREWDGSWVRLISRVMECAASGREAGSREGVARAAWEIAGRRRERAGRARQPEGDDQIARFEDAFSLGRVARKTMKRLDRNFARAGFALDLHERVERDQRHTEIRRVGGDAGLAPAEYGVQSVLAAAGIAAGVRLAFVAGAGGVVEISASRSLQQIAADR